MDQEYPIDVSLTSAAALPAGTADRLRAVKGIDQVVSVSATQARVSQGRKAGGEIPVLGVPEDTSLLRGTHAFAHPRPDTAYVAWDTISDLGLDPGGRLTLKVGAHRETLRISPTYAVKGTVLVAPTLLDELSGGHALTRSVWARTSDDVDAEEAQVALKSLAKSAGADLGGGMANRAYVDLQLDIMVVAVLALLGIALVIALIGIGNTLGLSVLERKREHAMLRALGLTRTQLRGTLAVEAVLLAAVTSVIGVALGSLYAFIGVKAVLEEALGETGVSIHVPVGQLLLVVVVASLAGLAACVLPARNAARITPAAGLAVE
jgi:putative ABC transport system permease protein